MMFLFFLKLLSKVPRPIAVKLCHIIGKWVLYKLSPIRPPVTTYGRPKNSGGGLPPKKWGPKIYKISGDFLPLQTLIAGAL